ncbi:MAG TPA: hypothetical protein PKC46_13320, partial [Sphingorhabdus sp.]|nr:hypothetical protein [Sphingorhabdus sp.]
TGDFTREIVIRNIVGRNLVTAEQIRIELNAAATDVKLVLDNIDITDSSGAQLGITIVNGSRVTSGFIGDNVLPAITGRPAKCQPLYAQHSVDLSGLGAGATSGDQLVAMTGVVAGHELVIVPRNVSLSILEARVTAANQIGFKVKNLGGGAGPNPALFDCYARRSKIA